MPPPPKPAPPVKLEVTLNSIRNTAIATDDDNIHYEIVTRFWHPHITKINRVNFETRELATVAEIEHSRADGKGGETRIRFSDKGDWMSASDFVKFEDEAVGGSFQGSGGVEYKWRTRKGQLQLVRADDPEKAPVAEFHPHKRHFFVFRMSRHAFLEVKPVPEVIDALDRLIASYLLVERKRRDSKIRIRLERSS
ncbi:hypothetical protein CERSUDRAFT_67952 [Gelatoporia subvermispora B]|uniref:DUF6593 domain-containing protein n=1 Tax=Ceriporiopsis subvermispora (strain B) TaxID=914234 RepID=M2R4K8_CERS8|nr:hypothetical protein CERSUDRAFT_67952 [Gelatoporia subvermispora B]